MAHIFDLPAEVRMEVFRRLLLTRHTKRAAPYKSRIPHALQPAILRVCYQFRQEAGDVLYRENVLIHVITNYPKLAYDLEIAGLASIVKGQRAKYFAHYSLQVHLFFHGITHGDHHFMIAVEDLPLFCTLFWLLKIRRDHQLSLRLTVLSPFQDLPPTIAKQESLLLPFQQLWHIARAAIGGFVDHSVSARLKAALTEKVPRPHEKILELVLSLKESGDQCTLIHDHFGGAIHYYQAFATCQDLRSNINFYGPTNLFYNPLGDAAKELTHCLMANITFAFLKLGAWEDAEEMAEATIWLSLEVRKWRDLIVAYFRRAIARKELGNIMGASTDFDSAAFHCRSLPNCIHVKRYIRMEEEASFGIGAGSDLDPWLKQARASFGFI